ncbi:hypothetical protein MUP01_05760 [Candidatus Bathyarchaeota archaeon]|nr:hypothetical protein [Candidatus Bathyarchaeota archaeon]
MKLSLPAAYVTSILLFIASYFARVYLPGGVSWLVICTIVASVLLTTYSKNLPTAFAMIITSMLVSLAVLYKFAVSVDFHDFRWLWNIWCLLGEEIAIASLRLALVYSLIITVVGMTTSSVVSLLKD